MDKLCCLLPAVEFLDPYVKPEPALSKAEGCPYVSMWFKMKSKIPHFLWPVIAPWFYS
jgi:hypothetical protein